MLDGLLKQLSFFIVVILYDIFLRYVVVFLGLI